MRFDIDALGVIESTAETHRPCREGFASVNHGMMHACGHDGHATIGLGVAKILMDIKEALHGTVKLIFQPAEEGVRGAKSIVTKGHLDNVEYFLSGHLTHRKPTDEFEIMGGGSGALATCKYDVVYHGKAAHAGGVPHTGRNALQAAASAVMNLYSIPRHGSGASRINVGTLVAGTGRNVIADEAKMEIEVRGETTEINRYMIEKAEQILKLSAEMYGCTCDIKLMGAAEGLTSDEDLALRIHSVCAEKLGMTVYEKPVVKSGGSEDVSYMMNRVQEKGGKATFMRLMTKMSGPAHDRTYDFSEEVIVNSIKAYCGIAADIME
jgi:aminobenzoyl-glutamate utilization protein A